MDRDITYQELEPMIEADWLELPEIEPEWLQAVEQGEPGHLLEAPELEQGFDLEH